MSDDVDKYIEEVASNVIAIAVLDMLADPKCTPAQLAQVSASLERLAQLVQPDAAPQPGTS